MTWWLPHKFEEQKPYLEKRMAMIRAVRSYFDGAGFWEVETPALQITPGLDAHIHGFKTTLRDVNLKPERDLYLHTSPEFAMKKLLVAGLPKIYQICHTFRDGEGSRLHSPEFTMLEWYRANADYTEIMEDCINLLRHVAQTLNITHYRYNGRESNPFKDWQKITVAEAFKHYADIDLPPLLDNTAAFAAAAQKIGVRVTDNDDWDDIFFAVMAAKIEPFLGDGTPCILYEYPAGMAALSRKKPGDPRFAERFEMYVCGVELCNAFGELTDAAEQRTRFTAEMEFKSKRYGESYPLDEDFLKALEHGMPPSGGNALGLDRLAMLATNADTIEQVLWAGKP